MFYVLIALRALLRERNTFTLPNLGAVLDLVALGTVADVVTLDQVNRTLVDQGLRRIRSGQGSPGIQALFDVARRPCAAAQASDLAFVIGPRLNAAGRLADMSVGIRCLLANDLSTALPFASELDTLNRVRREVEADIQQEALDALQQSCVDDTRHANRYTICLARPDWHPGVIGIVASRLKDHFSSTRHRLRKRQRRRNTWRMAWFRTFRPGTASA
jgi:single-stranded-DNA-specific exonuclease